MAIRNGAAAKPAFVEFGVPDEAATSAGAINGAGDVVGGYY